MSRSRNWCFTINNPHVADEPLGYAEIEETLQYMKANYYVFQLEMGDSGTPHWQGYVQFRRQVRMDTLKRALRLNPHLEPRYGSHEDASEYCKKTDNTIEGPYEYGESKEQGKRTDLIEFVREIRAGKNVNYLIDNFTREMATYHRFYELVRNSAQQSRNWIPEVRVHYGATGTGKSFTAHNAGAQPVSISAGGHFVLGYANQEKVLFDDFDPATVPFRLLLNLLDRYPLIVNVKGGQMNWNPKVIYITCEMSPEQWYPHQNYAQLYRRITHIYHHLDIGNTTTVKEPAAPEVHTTVDAIVLSSDEE